MTIDEPPTKRRRIVVDTNPVETVISTNEDLLLVVFSFLDVPILLLLKSSCRWWQRWVNKAIDDKCLSRGKIAFTSNQQLIEAVQKYCEDKRKNAEFLASRYGWPINIWDVSEVTDFSGVFEEQCEFNENIGDWDMSNAVNMDYMFLHAHAFHQDLSRWNISNVKSMVGMFHCAFSFNGNISTWDTSNVELMTWMFSSASAFNQDLSSWNTSNVKIMARMFYDAPLFHQDLSTWDLTSIQMCHSMFDGATSFDITYAPWSTSEFW
mmetsp:Transcript_10073/g.15429  ORF Transcript_10073/g.15429 Transcript_10073/m.15429 type:complete len:265 (+) Transcript_10073:92-886(+)